MNRDSGAELLRYAARRASRHSFFLAADLENFRTQRGFQESDMANFLGCIPDLLPELALCRRPQPQSATFRQDVLQIGDAFGLDPERLLRLIREAETLKALGSPGQVVEHDSDRGLLMAARDVVMDESTATPEEENDKDSKDGR